MASTRKRLAILVAAGLVLVACGGGDDADGGTGGAAVVAETDADGDLEIVVDERILAAANQLTVDFTWGDDFASEAFIFGMERGYDLEQLLAAAITRVLDNEGYVVADGAFLAPESRIRRIIAGRIPQRGEVIEPAGPRQRAILLPDEPQGFRRTLDQPVPVSDFLGAIRQGVQSDAAGWADISGSAGDEDRNVALSTIIFIARLASSGYSLDQIVEALILDTASLGVEFFDRGDDGKFDCHVLNDPATGELIPPKSNDLVWDCSQFVAGKAAASTPDAGDTGDPAVAEEPTVDPSEDVGDGDPAQPTTVSDLASVVDGAYPVTVTPSDDDPDRDIVSANFSVSGGEFHLDFEMFEVDDGCLVGDVSTYQIKATTTRSEVVDSYLYMYMDYESERLSCTGEQFRDDWEYRWTLQLGGSTLTGSNTVFEIVVDLPVRAS